MVLLRHVHLQSVRAIDTSAQNIVGIWNFEGGLEPQSDVGSWQASNPALNDS